MAGTAGTLGGTLTGTTHHGPRTRDDHRRDLSQAATGVVIRGTTTGSGNNYTGDGDPFAVNALTPTKLAITSVNGGANVATRGAASASSSQSQAGNGAPTACNGEHDFSLSVNTGAGTIGGTVTGTIAAGASSVTVTGVTYTNSAGESGVRLAATRTGGDALTAGISAAFTVIGAANKIALSGSSPTSPPEPRARSRRRSRTRTAARSRAARTAP